ncbi:MAG: diaminopimelate epimerase [Acidobacteriota bacterium]
MIEFWKMSGAGNDFILFDNRSGELKGDIGEVVRRICTRALSVGADGAILAERSAKPGADVRMFYWNSDGRPASFCANGARCLARFAVKKGIARGPKVRLETDAGTIEAQVHDDGRVTLPIPGPYDIVSHKPIRVDTLQLEGSFAIVGVPHYVLPVKNLWKDGIEELGRKIRRHADFEPEGANVDFVTVKARDTVQIRTYERGVERETLSCGSGCVAAALCLARLGEVESPVTLKTRSGIDLTVAWLGGGGDVTDVRLTGDARLIFQGFLEDEAAAGFPLPER